MKAAKIDEMKKQHLKNTNGQTHAVAAVNIELRLNSDHVVHASSMHNGGSSLHAPSSSHWIAILFIFTDKHTTIWHSVINANIMEYDWDHDEAWKSKLSMIPWKLNEAQMVALKKEYYRQTHSEQASDIMAENSKYTVTTYAANSELQSNSDQIGTASSMYRGSQMLSERYVRSSICIAHGFITPHTDKRTILQMQSVLSMAISWSTIGIMTNRGKAS